MGRAHLLQLLANGTSLPLMTPASTEAPYDHRGAMWFVVTVVTVYAMAILFMIVSHINRRAGKRELDREVSIFLRSTPTVRIEEERQRRRNLKRAMQPFIKLALDRRTVAVQVSSTGGGGGSRELLTLPSMETLTSLSAELLPMTNRVLPARSRRLSGLFGGNSETSLHSGCTWHGGATDEADIRVVCGLNEKIVQCCLDPAESLLSRVRRRPRVAERSETELGESASSRQHQMLSDVMEQQQQQRRSPPRTRTPTSPESFSRWPLHQPDLDDLEVHHLQSRNWLQAPQHQLHEEGLMSPSRTHVPRFLAMSGMGRSGGYL